MTEDQNVATVRSAYEAFARQDIPAVLATFDPQIEWTTPEELPIGGTVHGHDGVVGFFQNLPNYFEELRVEPDEYVASDDHVMAIGHHRGRVSGKPFEIGFAMHWTMRDGKAIQFREYNDSGKLMRIAGWE
jgi:ketosteroid isomerase-like protein